MAGVMLVQNTVHTHMLMFVKQVEIILVKARSTCLSNDETDSIVQLLFCCNQDFSQPKWLKH